MKFLPLIVCLIGFFVAPARADEWVNGYTTKSGTYVSGHYRSDPDGTQTNNWSTTGNVNPHTGKVGHRRAKY